jgi:hypothetical protein
MYRYEEINKRKLLKLNTIFKLQNLICLLLKQSYKIKKLKEIKKDVIKTKSSTHSSKYNKFK